MKCICEQTTTVFLEKYNQIFVDEETVSDSIQIHESYDKKSQLSQFTNGYHQNTTTYEITTTFNGYLQKNNV